jgi:ABC-type antimicrobial peptide transport system permease subunit
VLPGIAVGVAASLALTSLLRTLLFGVKPYDAISFVAAVVVLSGVALVAAYVPARRASRLTPVDALRAD